MNTLPEVSEFILRIRPSAKVKPITPDPRRRAGCQEVIATLARVARRFPEKTK